MITLFFVAGHSPSRSQGCELARAESINQLANGSGVKLSTFGLRQYGAKSGVVLLSLPETSQCPLSTQTGR
jgi:hypothetical protein